MAALRCVCSSLAAPRSARCGEKSRGVLSAWSKKSFLPTQFWTVGALCAKPGRNLSRGTLLAAAAGADDDDGGGGGGGGGNAADSSAATKGRQLWRRELESGSELSDELESLDAATLERDIERFAEKEERERLLWSRAERGSSSAQAAERTGSGSIIRDVADKILVADFFFILFILGWLLAGLAEQGALQSTRLIDSWLPLWPSVFQPALGVFMAGALVSAITKKK